MFYRVFINLENSSHWGFFFFTFSPKRKTGIELGMGRGEEAKHIVVVYLIEGKVLFNEGMSSQEGALTWALRHVCGVSSIVGLASGVIIETI